MSIGKSSLARAAVLAGTAPEPAPASVPAAMAVKSAQSGFSQVAVADIAVSGKKPAVPEALVRSVAENGILEPLYLARTEEGKLTVISGAKRLQAAKEAGLTVLPAVVADKTAKEAASIRNELIKAAKAAQKEFPRSAEIAEELVSESITEVGDDMPDWLL